LDDQQASQSAPPAKGLAAAFNSVEATQRLAALTGATVLGATTVREIPQTATQAVKSLPKPSTNWRRRDWLVVGLAALCGVAAAGSILKRPDR
jgi:hypothetical protein